jgi:hypothetical protein
MGFFLGVFFFLGGTPSASFFPYKCDLEQVFSANHEKQDIPNHDV